MEIKLINIGLGTLLRLTGLSRSISPESAPSRIIQEARDKAC